MGSSNDVVRARINRHIKEEATNVLAGMGLTVSDAIRMLLTQIASDKALPFDINRVHAEQEAVSFCLYNSNNSKA